MPLTSQQDLPSRPETAQPWTARPLLFLRSAVSTVAKTFNALEAILIFQISLTGIGEIAGRRMSIGWYCVVVSVLGIDAYLRIKQKDDDEK